MIGLVLIATTLLTRGVTNMQEAAFLFAAPSVAVANYTYYFLEQTGFNYTEAMNSLPAVPDSLFDMDFWMNEDMMSRMRDTKEYLIKEVPAAVTDLPKSIYQRLNPSTPLNQASNVDLGMVFVGMYLMSLFTLAAAIWLLKPGARTTYEEIDSDHILVRKRKRTPQRYYDEGRMQLRSMTTDEDVFYALE
jgi:hypothetical protein